MSATRDRESLDLTPRPRQWAIKVIVLILIAVPALSANAIEKSGAIKSTYGITIPMPGGVNLVTTQYLGPRIGVRLTGGYLPARDGGHLAGGQVGLVWKAKEWGSSLADIGLIGGYSEIDRGCPCSLDDYWRYGGAAGSYKWRAFFVEGGLTFGSGTYSNPQAVLQIGVIFKTFR